MATMATIPMTTGYSPQCWRYRLECSLQKKSKGLKADELRTIVLMEADLNMCLKTVFGHRMMRNAEHSPEYPQSQFGSKRGSRAIEAVRLKRACYDNSRLLRDPSVMMTTDLHSCYDRIVHSIASLTARKHGVQMQPITMMLETLRQSINMVRTAYGDSDRTYGSE